MKNILIADDHPLVLSSLKNLISNMQQMAVVCEANDGNEVLDYLNRDLPLDLILMDLSMPHGEIELIEKIRVIKPAVPILVLSMHTETVLLQRVLQAGATGYVSKQSDPEILCFAIEQVSKGQRFIDPTMLDSVLNSSKKNPNPNSVLSPKELQIFLMMGEGKSLKEISDQLNISIKTTSTHKARIMNKLNLSSNVELSRYLVKNMY